MILTSGRVICVNKKSIAFKAFDLPLSLISNESFEQPIFGANYITGKCKPLLNSLPGDITFKIWLMNGGCGTFAPAYLKMVASCRRNRGRGAEQSVINSYQNSGGRKTAYIDPNDPSVIYLQQPEVAQNINYNPFGYQPIPQSEPMQVNSNNYQPPPPQPQPYMQNNNYNNYNYQQNQNQMIQPQHPPMNNNDYMVPPNYGNNVNNNYPNFNDNNPNQQGDLDLPSEQDIYNSQMNNNQQQAYPNQGMGGLNQVINDQQQQQGGAKYFGFWGPNLDRNPNQPNNNGQ